MAHDPQLHNEDLAPVDAGRRTWGRWHIAALWIGMCVCIPTYQLASGLVQQGMAWWQGVITVTIANAIVLVPMVLNAHAGTKYGIPFPVFARASYGVIGANLPAVMRAIVACGWFGIQTWFGGLAIFVLINAFGDPSSPVLASLPPADSPLTQDGWWRFWMALGLSPGQLGCFLLFWLINVFFIWRGTESIKWMESLAAPFLIVAGLALLVWAFVRAGSAGAVLSQGSTFPEGTSFWTVFLPGLTANVGFWATLSLNIPDFTRFSRSQRDQVVGQAIGLPPTMALFSFIGVAVTAATPLIFGEMIDNPVALTARMGTSFVVVASLFALTLATLSTNIAANVVSPANDFSNLRPGRISYKLGGYITAVIGILMMPWKLLASAGTYLFIWLIGYSALLGPIGGVMIADYFLLRKTRLEVDDLYRRGGSYEYRGGINLTAVVATLVAILPNLPGFLFALAAGKFGTNKADQLKYLADLATREGPGWVGFAKASLALYDWAWFTGFLLAAGIYTLASTRRAPAAAPAAPGRA
ncbi:MAG: NCS1 family nucleobase:cation symporter-1 [Myxococcales bacterium]|nr:NCS1 family nucleobase:cation symporter-1 [Myxococcales bacterium]